MYSKHLFFCVLSIALSVGTVSFADEPADAEKPVERHKVGHYQINVPGAPYEDWLRFGDALGATIDVAKARAAMDRGVQWIGPDGGGGENYQIIAPKSYKPGVAHGVLVFVNAGDSGVLPNPYHPLLEKHRLIAIGADNSGNKRDVLIRHALATGAIEQVRQRYDIDEDRIYLTGVSGGGRVTSQAMIIRADLFDGGIPWVGANACIPMQNADSKGNTFRDQGVWRKKDNAILRRAGTEGRYAFISGDKDYNRPNVKAVAEGYKGAGFRNVTYIEQPGLGHANPDAEHYEKALVFLDAPLKADAQKHYEQAQRMDKAGRKDQALELYRKAAAHGGDAEWRPDADAKAVAYQAEHDASVAAIEAAIEAVDTQAFQKATAEYRRDWRTLANERLKSFVDRFNEARQAQNANP